MSDYTPEEMRDKANSLDRLASSTEALATAEVGNVIGAIRALRSAADQIDHLASSGPAGEIDVIKHLEEQNHRFATDMENQDDVIEKLKRECEAQKARAIRAEGECQRLRELLRLAYLYVEPPRHSTKISPAQEHLLTEIQQALTPAPDHAKGEW